MKQYKAYSVKITDDQGTRGTGVILHIDGFSAFYVITCAHVIRESEQVVLHLLIQTENGNSDETEITVGKESFHFNGTLDQENDLAVIECTAVDFPIQRINYRLYPMCEGESILALGYPQLHGSGPLYYQQDSMSGSVLSVLDEQTYFLIRSEDVFLDQADRKPELQGFSGSPVWQSAGLEKGKYLLGGIISSGESQKVHRARLRVISAKTIQAFLINEFGIRIDNALPDIEDAEIAPGYEERIESCKDSYVVRDSWIKQSCQRIDAYIEDRKIRKAIEVCQETIYNSFYSSCSEEQQYSIYALLLKAYRYSREYKLYDEVRKEMDQKGIHNDREYLIAAIRYYEDNKIQLAEEYIKKALEINPDGNEECTVEAIIRASADRSITAAILSSFIGERDQLLIKPKDKKEEEGIYQLLGFTFAFRFNDIRRGIRCLNRAYQIGGSYWVLETLGTAYCLQALSEASQEELKKGIIRNSDSLSRARDAFIRVISASDDMAIAGLFFRCGLMIYRSFYLSADRFRVVKHYHDIISNYEFPSVEAKKEVQLEYLRIAVCKEHLDLQQFDALSDDERKYFELIQMLDNPGYIIESEIQLQKYIAEIEKRLCMLQSEMSEQTFWYEGVHRKLVYLYAQGIQDYHWEAVSEAKRHCDQLQDSENKSYCSLLIDEIEGKEVEKHYIRLYEGKKNRNSFTQLVQFYIRSGEIIKAKEQYDQAVMQVQAADNTEIEMLYRDYLDFYIRYGLNLKKVIKHFVEQKDRIKDAVFRLYYQQRLSVHTGIFNNPMQIIEEIRFLYEEEVICDDDYREKCLAVLLYNLDIDDASKYVDSSHNNTPKASPMETRYFILKKPYLVRENPYWDRMSVVAPEDYFDIYSREAWAKPVTEVFERFNTIARKAIVVDFRTIYYLLQTRNQGVLALFDQVYITHYSIYMAMEDMVNVNDELVRRALYHLSSENNVVILSPKLEDLAELLNDDDEGYTETLSALVLSEVINCPAMIGEFRNPIPERYKDRIVRPYRFPEVSCIMTVQARIE